jgi:hypothetical protein
MLARLSLKSLAAASALLLAAGTASADVFNGTGGDIPDLIAAGNPGVLTTNINVPAGFGTVTSFNSISLNFGTGTTTSPRQHTWGGDLAAILTAPNGDNAHVFVRVGGTSSTALGDSSDWGGAYTFTNIGPSFAAAATTAGVGSIIANGSYGRFTNATVAPRPTVDTDDFTVFHGDDGGGTWTLTIQDWTGGDTGSITGWSIDITSIPEPASMGMLAGVAALPLLRRRRK